MKKNNLGLDFLSRVLPLWRDGQIGQEDVFRWKSARKNNPNLREQSTIAHLWGISYLTTVVLSRLNLKGVDSARVYRAVIIHDVSEGILGRDILWANKTDEKNLEEYLAVMKYFRKMPAEICRMQEEDFLLQFAIDNPVCFPEEARQIMSRLWEKHRHEVLIFQAVEITDYLLYALEAYHGHDDEDLLADVLRNQTPHLDMLTKELPRFGKYFWTPSMRRQACEFVELHPKRV